MSSIAHSHAKMQSSEHKPLSKKLKFHCLIIMGPVMGRFYLLNFALENNVIFPLSSNTMFCTIDQRIYVTVPLDKSF